MISKIFMLYPLLKFLSEYVLEFSVEANLRHVPVLRESDAIDLIQDQLENMFLNPWEYGLNADGIMKCYELYEDLNELKEKLSWQ